MCPGCLDMRQNVFASEAIVKLTTYQKYAIYRTPKRLNRWHWRTLFSQLSFGSCERKRFKDRTGPFHTLSFNCSWYRCRSILSTHLQRHRDTTRWLMTGSQLAPFLQKRMLNGRISTRFLHHICLAGWERFPLPHKLKSNTRLRWGRE